MQRGLHCSIAVRQRQPPSVAARAPRLNTTSRAVFGATCCSMSTCDCRWQCSAGASDAATLLATRRRVASSAACCTSNACTVPPAPTARARCRVSLPFPHVASTTMSRRRTTCPQNSAAMSVMRALTMSSSKRRRCSSSSPLPPPPALDAARAPTAAAGCSWACRCRRCRRAAAHCIQACPAELECLHVAPCTCGGRGRWWGPRKRESTALLAAQVLQGPPCAHLNGLCRP